MVTSQLQFTTKCAPHKILKLGQTKSFEVVEVFSGQDIISQPLSRIASHKYMIGGFINCGATVANGGVVMSGQPIHVRLDVDNQSRYIVDQITLTLYQHVLLKADHNNTVQSFLRTKQQLLVGVKDIDVRERQRLIKNVKLTPKSQLRWQPSITCGSLINVTYELVINFFVFAENIELRVPIKIVKYSSLLEDELPNKIECDFGPNLAFTPDNLEHFLSSQQVPQPEERISGEESGSVLESTIPMEQLTVVDTPEKSLNEGEAISPSDDL
eukprot:TRINITY_DN10736_c0_g1_i1.p1 TRINITY_DN10736_c0_g1~~TRINITY_DN10736_c0_g1_i1.p1  ORF type:complete len:270 (-),score=64.98 TRINITY_DN10736_c0_g1_i1:91-900(-)